MFPGDLDRLNRDALFRRNYSAVFRQLLLCQIERERLAICQHNVFVICRRLRSVLRISGQQHVHRSAVIGDDLRRVRAGIEHKRFCFVVFAHEVERAVCAVLNALIL